LIPETAGTLSLPLFFGLLGLGVAALIAPMCCGGCVKRAPR